MTRIVAVIMLILALLAAPLAVGAQPAGKVYRIGALSPGGSEQDSVVWESLRGLLREREWIEGQTLVVERCYADGNYQRLPELAAGLIRLKLDLLVTRGGPAATAATAATAAKRATATIPIVMWNATDPVGIGRVASLARPGGNVTGLSDDQGPEIIGKRLQLLNC